MKDQDLINSINKHTSDLPIPDSISPANMQKMLDEHKTTQQNSHTSNNDSSSSHNVASSKHAVFKGCALAACLAVCVLGGRYFLNPSPLSDNTGVDSEQASTSGTKTQESETSLVAEASPKTPSSYDEYYDTLKKAYDDYYDSISSVTTDVLESAAESDMINFSADSSSTATKQSAATGESANSYSKTNIQEDNVDEGDLIKTDGSYIYRMTTSYDEKTYDSIYRLTITQTDQGKLDVLYNTDLKELLSITSDDTIDFHEFYLQKEQLFILYTKQHIEDNTARTQTYIAICNLKDKEHPKLTQNLSQSGYYVSSRISNGYLYTISNFNETSLQNKKQYEEYIPSVNGKTISCDDLYYPDNILMDSTYVVTSLSLDDHSDFKDTKAFSSSSGDTYVSDSAIYLYCTQYNDVTQTKISRIAYKNGTLTVGNSATVAGYFYDSFALSEKDGYLRMVATIPANNIALFRDLATEKDSTENTITEDVNALYILDSDMNLVSKLTGIAPGEQIYSARFLGDMGYFVTYRNTDPLYSVDLSDPKNPTIVGQLKIPGFSNYLHAYDDGILLGIGQDIDPATQVSSGIKLSMFDISDPENVTERNKYVIENSEYSPALYDHKAIMINTDDNIFGFVYTTYDSSTDQYGYYFATYTYDSKKGFVETARYRLNQKNEYDYDSVRGIYIGDYLYLSNNEQIVSYKLGDTTPISTQPYN